MAKLRDLAIFTWQGSKPGVELTIERSVVIAPGFQRCRGMHIERPAQEVVDAREDGKNLAVI